MVTIQWWPVILYGLLSKKEQKRMVYMLYELIIYIINLEDIDSENVVRDGLSSFGDKIPADMFRVLRKVRTPIPKRGCNAQKT